MLQWRFICLAWLALFLPVQLLGGLYHGIEFIHLLIVSGYGNSA